MADASETVKPERAPIPATLPVLPLNGTVVYPMALAPLGVGQQRSVRLVDEVMRKDRMMVVALQFPDAPESPPPEQIHRIGTVVVVHQLLRAPDGSMRLIVQGIERIRIVEYTETSPYLIARIEVAAEASVEGPESEALRRAVVEVVRRLLPLIEGLPEEVLAVAEGLKDSRQLAYLLSSTVPIEVATRQQILEIDPVDAKLRRLLEVLQHELDVREMGRKITSDVEGRFSKMQREHYLREQIRSIQKELGEPEEGSDAADLKQKIELAGLPVEARREADRELARLADVPPSSPEHGIIRTYLEWLADLPWSKLTGGDIDLERARSVLDEDHYDLEKVKDRILEYLAVKKLRQSRATPEPAATAVAGDASREPILCFVGPPGVGKTSLGVSIARALGRQFWRISLGGVHDESEIRGHRRTYIGAMPGRIIQALKRVGSRDPVFMLDEIDKVGADWRGDPAAALLEVLDPAQNQSFTDTYLGVAFDLSQVLFIATANTLDTIPAPLRDRMEVLSVSGYTEEEKVRIGARYLVPKQLAAAGLTPSELTFEEEALRDIVAGYTREAGVRNLDREIATVCRKVARAIAEGRAEPVRLTAARLEIYLGPQRFFAEVAERTSQAGVATGLAWTPAGGDVLFVEATMMPSPDEKLILTGMLGDVMRESVQAALSYVRSNAERLGADPAVFSGKTVHVHVPAGAIPKDGPSAGVTMVTALASLATGRPVRSDVAMTGEITLRGKVLPVGGIKEKVLAAHRAGIRTILLPRRNERDLQDLSEDVRKALEFVLIDTAEELLPRALESPGSAAVTGAKAASSVGGEAAAAGALGSS